MREIFRPEAVALVLRLSRGIPRLIIVICDNCLFEAFLVKKEHIDAAVVDDVARDLGLISAGQVSGRGPVAAGQAGQPPARPASGGSGQAPERRRADNLLSKDELESLGLLHEFGGG